MKTQKELKRLKKDIVDRSAINIGYSSAILQNLPNYALIEALRIIGQNNLINGNESDADRQNIFVTECIDALNFQDFKEVSKFFFQPK